MSVCSWHMYKKGTEYLNSCVRVTSNFNQTLKNVCLVHSEMYLNSCICSIRLKRMMYLNIEIKTDLMCLLLVGGFAFVYEAQDLGSGKDYALKVILIYFTIGL